MSAIINTHGACAVLTVLPSVSSVPDPKPTSMSKALKVRHLGWLMRTMGESVHWTRINWVSKELNIYPFTNASVVLVSSYWDVDWWSDGASVPGTQTTSDSEYTSAERDQWRSGVAGANYTHVVPLQMKCHYTGLSSHLHLNCLKYSHC